MRPMLRRGLGPLLMILSCCFCWTFSEALRAADSPLRIASFNIQVFGQSKMRKAPVVSTLLRILDRYDLVFIMEIRDNDNVAIFDLLDRLNKQSAKNYQIIVSERLGRSDSKEQYAYLFNPDKVVPDASYVFEDSKNQFEREPYVAHFKAGATDFTMIGIHTTPSDVSNELRALPAVYAQAKAKFQSSDVFVLGDLNADCSYYHESEGFNYFPDPVTVMVGNDVDTTVAQTNCTYDRVLAFGSVTRSASQAVPFNFPQAYGLDEALAKEVSDHYPVEWTLATVPGSMPPPVNDSPVYPLPLPPIPSFPPPTNSSAGKCGLNPTLTKGGYCYADLARGRGRVANACCPR